MLYSLAISALYALVYAISKDVAEPLIVLFVALLVVPAVVVEVKKVRRR